MKIYIKYMVSMRCKMVVRAALEELGFRFSRVDLGEAETIENIEPQKLEALRKTLLKSGLELMDDKRAILIEKIRKVVIEMVHYNDEPIKINFSDFLSEKLNLPYSQLSTLFSEVTGTTIEHFVIIHRIERVKELLLYDELNLTEIADKLNYSSVSHLSNQFKKITGLSPSYFKKMRLFRKRNTLENL